LVNQIIERLPRKRRKYKQRQVMLFRTQSEPSRRLKNVVEEAVVRQISLKKSSLRGINGLFGVKFNAETASKTVFRQLAWRIEEYSGFTPWRNCREQASFPAWTRYTLGRNDFLGHVEQTLHSRGWSLFVPACALRYLDAVLSRNKMFVCNDESIGADRRNYTELAGLS